MSRRMPMAPMALPLGSRRAEAFRLAGMTSPLALRGFRTTFRMTPRSTTSRSAAVNSRVSSGVMKRESDCSSTSAWRNPSSWETASLACTILPSRSETNTGSGALAIMMSASSEPCDLRPLPSLLVMARSEPSFCRLVIPDLPHDRERRSDRRRSPRDQRICCQCDRWSRFRQLPRLASTPSSYGSGPTPACGAPAECQLVLQGSGCPSDESPPAYTLLLKFVPEAVTWRHTISRRRIASDRCRKTRTALVRVAAPSLVVQLQALPAASQLPYGLTPTASPLRPHLGLRW